MAKRANYNIGEKLVWRDDGGTWIESLQDRHGNGPFLVYNADWAKYGTPQVKIQLEDGTTILNHADDEGWFGSACFMPFEFLEVVNAENNYCNAQV